MIPVKNISLKTIYLESGKVVPGAKGFATRAESETLYSSLERIEEAQVVKDRETMSFKRPYNRRDNKP